MLPVAAFIGPAVSVSAQEGAVLPLKWEVVDKPSIRGEIVIVPSEVNRIATSRDIVYAVDTANSRLHRSDNGGLTFTEITTALSNAGAQLPVHEIGVAPDRPQYVAVSDNVSSVYWSDDNGATWNDTGFPAVTGIIQCIAISNGYRVGADLYHDLAIGTAAWGDAITTGQIWTLKVGKSFAGWQNQALIFPGHPGAEVSAIAFSPQYNSDSTILAVASTADDLVPPPDNNTWLCIGLRDTSLQTTTWNNAASYPGYPVRIDSFGDTPGVSRISCTLSLPSDYSSTIASSRLAFVSYNRDPDGHDDVYRVWDDKAPQCQALNVAGGAADNISSIAYYGTLISGKLLAGESNPNPAALNMVQVRRTLYPLGTPIGTPNTTTWNIATQPPSGPGNAQVAWSNLGTVAFCGTGQLSGAPLDESAFSQSYDNGDNWEQTSLINTLIRMSDIAPAPDSRSLFMATFNTFGPEGVWRSAGEPLGTYWSRLLSMRTFSNRVLLRLSPDYRNDYTIYAVEAGSDNQTMMMAVSKNRGNTWKKRYIPGPVIDMVAAGKNTLYLALPGGCVRKSTDSGITWGVSVMTGLDNINMLTLADNGHLFAGSRDSKVAYSTDNGTSFTEIIDPMGLGAGFVQVVADANYSRNNIIYAADNVSDKGVWRRIIGQSTQWEQMDETITGLGSGQIISGLMVGPEGTLYALRAERPKPDNRIMVSDNHTGGMNRTLNPTVGLVINIEWDIVNRTLTDSRIAFTPEPLRLANNPPWLKLSGNSEENMLWAIDTANLLLLPIADNTSQIFRFRDNLCKIGPWINSPEEIGCDPVSGRNQQVDLAWEQLSLTDRYQLQLAKDRNFTLKINPEISAADNVSSVTGSILINTDPVNVTSPAVWLPPGSLPEAGAFYYWRIRCYHAATWEFIRSPWSDTARFLVKPGFPVTSPYYGPHLLSPEDGCGCPCNTPVSFSWSPYKEATKYKFEFSENADMSRPLVSASLKTTAYRYNGQFECNKNYFWRVMALEPVPGDWSATFSFQVQSAQPDQAPAERNGSAPLWAWIVMAVGIVTSFVQFIILLRRQEIL